MTGHRRTWLVVVALTLALCACGGASQANLERGTPGGPGTLQVFAASSLTDAFTTAARQFEAAHPGARVELNFGGSPALRAQIGQGARADVLATADAENMDAAFRDGLVRDRRSVFARNRLVIIVPKDNPAGIATPSDLGRPGVKLVLAADGVPAGTYARQAIAKMASDPSFSARFEGAALGNVVSNETNVKAVAAKIQLGEGDAGIVYASDVTPAIAPDVRVIDVPDAFNVIAEYPIAITKDARRPHLAQQFIDYMRSGAGQAILARSGFMAAP